MAWRNASNHYGWVTIVLHWSIALGVLVVFFLGLWMVTLDYYSPWYHQAPWVHKSIGVILVTLMLLRWVWHRISTVPQTFEGVSAPWQQRLIKLGHQLMYWLVFLIGLSGYLIATAEGKPFSVFDAVSIPALPVQFDQQADVAGLWHQWLAYALIALVTVHAAAALKHHFVNRDRTLKRILKSE